MPYDASIVNDPQFKSLSESKQAKILANLVPSDMRGTQTAESNRQISSSEQLVQDYPPYRTGWEAAKREVSDVPGGFGLLSAPGVGVGEESGTAVHNVLAGVPGLGGPSGFAPAAGATLANLAGQFATDALLPGIVSRGAKAIAAPVRTVARWLDPFNKEKAINQFAQKHLGLPENIGSRITQLGEEAPTTLPVFPESVPGPSTPLDVKATVELLKDKATGKFAADYLGMPSSKGERIVNMGKEAFNLYKVAEATGTKIALTEPRAIIEDTLSSLTRTGREKLADDLVSKLSIPPQAKQANYSEVFRWVQEFRSKADALLGADNAAAAQLRKSAEGLLSKLDDSSTVVREANARYRLDQAAKVTLEALSGSKPAIKLKNLMQSDPSLAKGLNLTKPADVEKFLKAAGDIGDTGSRGGFVEKQGKITPGVYIPIVNGNELYVRKPDYLLLLAWNFVDEIMQKTKKYAENGGKYIVPVPKLKII